MAGDEQQGASGADAQAGSSSFVIAGRGFAGTIVSGGCGCSAFLVGAVLAVALFAPQLMSGWAKRILERQLSANVEGDVQVGDLSLAWGAPQRAESVTVTDPDGDTVLLGSMRFPSLLNGVDDTDVEREFVFDVTLLRSRINADGTSNLGRTFGVTAASGETVLHALMGWGIDRLESLRADGSAGDAVSVRVELAEAEIDDTASGRGIVRLRDLSFTATTSRAGLDVELERCTVLAEGRRIPLAFSANYGRRRNGARGVGADELLRASLRAEGMETDTLLTLGLLPRSEQSEESRDPRLMRDVFDRLAPKALAAVGKLLTGAETIELDFGVPKDGPSDADPELSVLARGPMGRVEVEALFLRDGRDGASGPVLVPLESGGRVTVALAAPGALAPLVEAVTPKGARVEPRPAQALGARRRDVDGDRLLTARLRSFELPVDPALLSLQLGRGREQLALGDRLASAFRRGSGEFVVAGGDDVVVAVGDGNPADSPDRLEARHVLTVLDFASGGGRFQSRWRNLGPFAEEDPRSGGRARPLSTISGDLPAASAQAGGASGTLDFDVRGVPMAMLDEVFWIEEVVTNVLGDRLRRFQLRGLDAGVLLGRRPSNGDVQVDLVTAAGDRISGSLSPGGFEVDRARFDLPLDRVLVDDVLLPLLPWIEGVELAPGQSERDVVIELERFTFPTGTFGGGLEGVVHIDPPPLRVQLPQSLLRDVRVGHEMRWVNWDPGRIEIVMDRVGATYQKVSLPIGGGQRIELTGTSRQSRYNLSGSAPAEVLRNLNQSNVREGALVQIQISNQGDVRQPRVLVSPAELVNVFGEIIDLLSPEKKDELLRRLTGK